MEPQLARTSTHSRLSAADEAVVLQRAQAGDRDAFCQLILMHQDRVFSIALRLTGQHADAEDVAQEVFVQLHGAMAQVASPSHLKHWLLRTVSHRTIDRLRQVARQGEVLPLEALAGTMQEEAPDASGDPLAAAHLLRLLSRLQPDAHAVLLLRFQEDLDPAEIATVMEMSINTVKSHLRRSLEWLRSECTGEHHGT